MLKSYSLILSSEVLLSMTKLNCDFSKMQKNVLIFFCVLVASTQARTPGLPGTRKTFYETVCNVTEAEDSFMDKVDWWGVSGALLPLIEFIPEIVIPAEVITVLGGLIGTLGGIKVWCSRV